MRSGRLRSGLIPRSWAHACLRVVADSKLSTTTRGVVRPRPDRASHAAIGPARRPSNSTLVAETVFALVRAALLLTSSPVDEPVYWAISESP